MKTIFALAAIAVIVLTAATGVKASAQTPIFTWHMVGGVSSTPKAFVDEAGFCDVVAVYNFTDSQEWEIWFNVPPEIEFLNDDFVMAPNRGYWVACRY